MKGTIYDPRDGKTCKCKMTLKKDGTLEVRGYVGLSLFGKTAVRTRIERSGGRGPRFRDPGDAARLVPSSCPG